MLTRFHSVVVDVADFDAAVRDYALLLGHAATLMAPDSRLGSRTARFQLSNAQLELRDLAPGPTSPRRGAEGIAGIRFGCTPERGSRLVPGRIEGPSVPIELVAETDSETAPLDRLRHGTGSAVASDPDLVGLDHVVVASPDPERTRRHFAEDLGIRLALDRNFAERGLRLIFFRLGGVTIEVASALGQTGVASGPDAFHGLAWKVGRIEAIHARLRAAGFDVSEIRPGYKVGTRVASLREALHGVPTLLIEHAPSAAGTQAG